MNKKIIVSQKDTKIYKSFGTNSPYSDEIIMILNRRHAAFNEISILKFLHSFIDHHTPEN